MVMWSGDVLLGWCECEIKIMLKCVMLDVWGENVDVMVCVWSLDVDVGMLKWWFVVNVVWDVLNVELVVLIYGGKVLWDDETLRDAFVWGWESVVVYGEMVGEGDGWMEMVMVDELGMEGEVCVVEEYVVYIVVRSARETSAEDSRATTTMMVEGVVNVCGGEGDVCEEGGYEIVVLVSEVWEMMVMWGDARDAGAFDSGTFAMFRGDVLVNVFVLLVLMFCEDVLCVLLSVLEYVMLFLMNVMY